MPPVPQASRERFNERDTSQKGRAPIPDTTRKGPSYQMKAPIEQENSAKEILDKLMKAEVTWEVEDLLAASEPVRKELIRLIAKKRVAPKEVNSLEEAPIQETLDTMPFAVSEEEEEVYLRPDAIRVEDLPPASVLLTTDRQIGHVPAGALIMDDPVLQYLDSLPNGTEPKQIYVAKESQSLRSVYPLINGIKVEESVTDGGSQIISMAERTALEMGISWNPDIRIHMQSANSQLEMTLGLARNIPFAFGDITVYLQVHIIANPAYKVLLGRPFDVLTESLVKNTADGGQTITIKDPNTGKRSTIPTFPRGQDPRAQKKETGSDF